MCAVHAIESSEQRRQLLQLARDTAQRACAGGHGAAPAKPDVPGRIGGAFVTLWNGKRLRGCIGTFQPSEDIAGTIEEVTRSSLKDARFTADSVTAGELAAIDIEISILSDPVRTDDPLSLVPGQHGIIVRRGGRSGCFLPKVASDRGWSAEEFLSQCCTSKAGLPADAWRDPETEVLLFESQAFSETELAGRA